MVLPPFWGEEGRGVEGWRLEKGGGLEGWRVEGGGGRRVIFWHMCVDVWTLCGITVDVL